MSLFDEPPRRGAKIELFQRFRCNKSHELPPGSMINRSATFGIPIVFFAALAMGLVQAGCNAPTQASAPDATASIEEELFKEPIDRGDPPPRCVPSCVGKPCGAPNGCGGKCVSGSCPSGSTCGGGGTPGVCACQPSCNGKSCGEPDGCGGTCNEGSCPAGQGCSIVSPGQCAPIPIGQNVECFVFSDGYSFMAGPSRAITFATDGQACIPDGTATGNCRKWWGRCRTTDASHTPVSFRVGDFQWRDRSVIWSDPSDAIFSKHFQNWFDPPDSLACLPNGTTEGNCHHDFGNGQTPDGRAVRCHVFDDGGANMSLPFTLMHDMANSNVFGTNGPNSASRKWFGECFVGGCGDGICDPNESVGTCSDCTCGNGVCDEGESAYSCAQDCMRCGDGVCNGTENTDNCVEDCTRCGDHKCTGGETCDSCSADCSCPKTCSGAAAGATAQAFWVNWENAWGCAGYSLPFANDYEEAKRCVGPYVTVHDLPSIPYWFYMYDPGCHDIRVEGYSAEGARRCAVATSGYEFQTEGRCP